MSGVEAVATVDSYTNGSYWRNYKLTWHGAVDAGAKLYPQATIDTLRAQLEAAEAANETVSQWAAEVVATYEAKEAELINLRAANIAYSQQVNELIGRAGNAEARAEAAEAELSGIRLLVEIVGETESRAVGAAAMYLAARASECNAGEIKTTMHGLTSAGKPIGDWDVTAKRSARTKEETK